ncbi:MAG: hypothetical protein QME62_00795 [Armatimonadota bacterium]|nr:hypothetical protein [Armatimonadota bacterium]
MNRFRQTIWQTSDEGLNDLWRWVVACAMNDYHYRNFDGRLVAIGPEWLRDHVHEMKAYKYFFADLTSGLEFFFRHQLSDGQFPDFFVPIGDQHQKFVHPDFELEDLAENRVFIRIPVEADLEYLAVEGVYQAWKATGDLAWVNEQMPALLRGLQHLTSNKWRWSSEHGLVKRPFTPDTWDFINFYDPDDHFKTNCEIRRMDETVPFCLFHGDNSGLYSACGMIGEMLRAINRDDEAQKWLEFGEGVRERANRLLWGDNFYIHQVHLDPDLERLHNERFRLSLSNPYDINRGLPTHKMAVSIIDAYAERWKLRKETHIAEWFTIDPPYEPRFGWYVPGEYVNGGLFGAVGGELAKAAFNHGREEYAVDILRRYHAIVKKDGEVRFMFWPDGRPYGGGPPGWCAAAFVSAMMEGLAGIEDCSTCFRAVCLSPRWAAADVCRANITVGYPSSGSWFSYRYTADSESIQVECFGSGEQLTIRLLLPKNVKAGRVNWGGHPLEYKIETVEESKYMSAKLPSQNGKLTVFLDSC